MKWVCSKIWSTKKSNNREGGFTTIEVVVAMALVAIVGGALLSGVSGALKLSKSARKTAITSISILKADDRIRSAAAQVRIPYWERSAAFSREGSELVFPWFHGEKTRTLRIGTKDDRLSLEADGIMTVVDAIEKPEIAVLFSEGGAPVALDIAYKVGDRDVRLVAPFGAHPLGVTGK